MLTSESPFMYILFRSLLRLRLRLRMRSVPPLRLDALALLEETRAANTVPDGKTRLACA